MGRQRRGIGKHFGPVAQVTGNKRFDHRAGGAGAESLAVDHAHAARTRGEAFVDKFHQQVFCLLGVQPVQIAFVFDRVLAAAQFAHDFGRQAGAGIDHFFAGLYFAGQR